MDCDVVVIGGGLSGLTAARDLQDAGQRCVLLEGGDRLGGRTYRRPFAGHDFEVELGGTYVDPHMHQRVFAELDRYGLGTVPAADSSTYRYALGGRMISDALPIPVEEALGMERTLVDLVNAARRIELGRGLDRQDLEDLDVSAEEFYERLGVPPVTRDLLLAWTWNMMGVPPSEASMLWMLQFAAAHHQSVLGVVLCLTDILAEGSTGIVTAIAEGIDTRLEHRVVAIEQDDTGVDVHTADGRHVRARAAVLATPLNTWSDIRMTPELAGPRRVMVDERHGCRGVKILVLAEDVPAGLSAAGVEGRIPTFYEYMPVGDRRLLVAFTDVDSIDPFDRQAVETELQRFVPEARVVAVDAHDWTKDPLFQGAWMSPRIGQITKAHSSLGQPHGRLFFAGSDVSLEWPGYIEGALETGARAAREAAALLGAGSAASD